jgi:hypothetical protein
MTQADKAMYRAKSAGGNRYAFFGGGRDTTVPFVKGRERNQGSVIEQAGSGYRPGGTGAADAHAL